MRLTEFQRQAIRDCVYRYFGSEARALLFGSRVYDTQRGGDIDILVEVADADPDSQDALIRKVKTVCAIQAKIGERKIDLIVAGKNSRNPVVQIARREGIEV